MSLSGGDIPRGFGWITLALAMLAAVFPYLNTARDAAAGRAVLLLCLGAGSVIVLYVLTQNIRFMGVGLIIVVAGYALEFAGALRDHRAAKLDNLMLQAPRFQFPGYWIRHRRRRRTNWRRRSPRRGRGLKAATRKAAIARAKAHRGDAGVSVFPWLVSGERFCIRRSVRIPKYHGRKHAARSFGERRARM